MLGDDAIRSTRSGRIAKQTSRPQLTASPASSRSRPTSARPASSRPTSTRRQPASSSRPQRNTSQSASRFNTLRIQFAEAQRILDDAQRSGEEATEKDRPESKVEVSDEPEAINEDTRAMAELLKALKATSYRGRSRRRHRSRSSHSSSSSSPDRRRRKSFKYIDHEVGKTLLVPIQERYPAVPIKHIEPICRGTSNPRTSLIQLSNIATAPVKDSDKFRSSHRLLYCVEVYSQFVCHFAHPAVTIPLHEALSKFRGDLCRNCENYIFESVKEWCLSYLAQRIYEGVNRPERNTGPGFTPRGHKSDNPICGKFNTEKGCNLQHCSYRHVCKKCQKDGHIASRCPENASGSNSVEVDKSYR